MWRIPVLLLFFVFPVTFVSAQTMNLQDHADIQLYSGEVIWTLTHELLVPMNYPVENKITGLSEEMYQQWIQNRNLIKKQNYTLQCIFKGNNLYFSCKGSAGEIVPVDTDQTLTFNTVSYSSMNHRDKTFYRLASKGSYGESSFAGFYIHPRFCGYGFRDLLSLAKKVKVKEDEILKVNVEEPADEDRFLMVGQGSQANYMFAELIPHLEFPQIFASTKYLDPSFGSRIVIVNEDVQQYSNEVFYPQVTRIERYYNGRLEDLENSTAFERITLKVESAEFNGEYPDEIFNPACPSTYTNLNDERYQLLQLSGQRD